MIDPTPPARSLPRRLSASVPSAALIGALALAATAGCGSSSGGEAGETPVSLDPRPEAPTILRDVSLIDDDVRFKHPYVPGHRTTADGRVAVQTQGGAHEVRVYLFAPEKLDEPIVTGPAGPVILADTEPWLLPLPAELEPETGQRGHVAVCDPVDGMPGASPNPYPCGPGGTHDCYDFTLLTSKAPLLIGPSIDLWGMPIHVEVADPKTPSARLVDASLGAPVRGVRIPLASEWTEPAITLDGRLLTGRIGGAPRRWTHPETGRSVIRQYDLGYFMLPDDAPPCDVTGWTTFHPMSHAPFDPQLVGRYGLASYPFRDTEGQPIEDGEDMGGTYPWVDREGKNVFMTGVPGRIAVQSEEQFPRRCVTPGCEEWREPIDWDRGFLVAGAWTHGKLVHLDAMINNVDWALPVNPAAHWMVSLYRDREGDDVEVRLGSGRVSVSGARREPPGFSGNANILDSLQHLLNHREAVRTVTPRDVVWVMGTGVATDEVVFDDYLDPDAFIVSGMQGSITQFRGGDGATLGFPRYWNGQRFRVESPVRLLPSLLVLEPGIEDEVHLQNAATSLSWNVPPYGLVAAGEGRVEPAALGGVKGKGFWLDGEASIHYEVPAQERSVTDVDWYLGIFVDPRQVSDAARTLALFPDGTAIRLTRTSVQYLAEGTRIREITLPRDAADGWTHLGLRIARGNDVVTLLHDGFALDRFDAGRPLFALPPGELVLGQAEAPRRGFTGWIDELKVLAHDVNPEVACNHAFGTLVRVEGDVGWASVAARYPVWAHDEVAAAAGDPSGSAYACFTDYTDDHAAHLGNIPAGTAGLREAINFPEGPLVAGAPRPDSSANPFCTSCHHDGGQNGLTVEALILDPSTPAELDPRRQPLQPPARVHGNVPAGWIGGGSGAGSPLEALVAPPEGLLVDPWLLPTDGG